MIVNLISKNIPQKILFCGLLFLSFLIIYKISGNLLFSAFFLSFLSSVVFFYTEIKEKFSPIFFSMTLALILTIPSLILHKFGLAGNVFLPMHLSVFVIGLLFGPKLGAIAGLFFPTLSYFATGMPNAFPMLPIMTCELFIYGFAIGFLYNKMNLSIYTSLFLSIVCGRLIYAFVFFLLFFANNGVLKAIPVEKAIFLGIPGTIIQFVFIPIIVKIVKIVKNYVKKT